MRRSRSTAVAHALAAVLLVFSCCLGFHFTPRAQERAPQEPAPGAHAQAPGDRQSVDLAKLYDAVVDTIEQKFFDEALLKRLDWRERAKAFARSTHCCPSSRPHTPRSSPRTTMNITFCWTSLAQIPV